MAADVSSLVRILNGYKEDGEGKGKRDLITRDLLGSKELDLDLQVPNGWEKRLDLLSGKIYLHKCSLDPVHRPVQDLNLPPLSSAAPTDDSAALDLRLVVPSSASVTAYNSVCTLEKVKSALERAERESRGNNHHRRSDCSPSPTSSTTSSSIKRRTSAAEEEEGMDGSDSSGGLMAAGCPSCLLYVLISKGNPRCPRCDSHVPVPVLNKKPRIDLNSTQNY